MSICFINECNDFNVLQEIKAIDTAKDTYKIRGASRLQTINEVNSNRRIYTTAIGERFVETANQKIERGRMLGELDHPLVSNMNDPAQMKRQMVVLWERVCHKFTKMWMENNTINGLLETTSNRHGIDVARMANIDGIPIGFSCRAMGKVRPSNLGKGIVEVTQPAIFVTYDCVTDPSHKSAELTDISSVITKDGELNRICESSIGSNNDIALDECNLLIEYRDFFNPKNSIEHLIENFVGNVSKADISDERKVAYGKKTIETVISEYLDTSDKINGVSTNPLLNESNIHSLMTDYSHNHKNYNTSKVFEDKLRYLLNM